MTTHSKNDAQYQIYWHCSANLKKLACRIRGGPVGAHKRMDSLEKAIEVVGKLKELKIYCNFQYVIIEYSKDPIGSKIVYHSE